jgi:serine/threonine protein kinase
MSFEEAEKRFKGLKILGAGAFAEIFSAKLNGKKVIVKVALLGGRGRAAKLFSAGDLAIVESLAHEADVLRRLQKLPFVPKLVEIGTDYFVMEDVGGKAMFILLRKTGLTAKEYLSAWISTLLILSMVHKMGISHNDVHLANVVLTPNGVVLIDFGTATIKNGPKLKHLKVSPFVDGMKWDNLACVRNLRAIREMDLPKNVRAMILGILTRHEKQFSRRRARPDDAEKLARKLMPALALISRGKGKKFKLVLGKRGPSRVPKLVPV